jgi:uncharacterized membrane protein YvbJ
MFCPRCGQQSPDEVRFCPKCGFHLAGLAAKAAEIYQPPSVTENTTKLLDKDS